VIHKIEKTIQRHCLLNKGEGVIVAVSGGPDSVALLKILLELSPRYELCLKVAHLNHGLRGVESDREEEFVRTLSGAMGLPFTSRKVDIRRVMKEFSSCLEDACRQCRYAYLEEVRLAEGFRKIALGHHMDDQAETVLMRFLRGSGPEGLRGMLPVRDETYIRPMLYVSRREIIQYLERQGLKYMNDSSNREDVCLRNRIRRELIPDLRLRYNPRLPENLARTAEILRLEDDYLEAVVRHILNGWQCAEGKDRWEIPLPEFLGLHEALRSRVVKTILRRFSRNGGRVGYRHVKAVLNVAAGENPGARLDMPFGVSVRREYDLLRFEKEGAEGRVNFRKKADGGKPAFCYEVTVPGEYKIAETGRRMTFQYVDRKDASPGLRNTVFMDCAGIDFPLTIRTWMPGDRIEPVGMKGGRKIHDIFIDSKIPRGRRAEIPLVVDRSAVLWIAGMRLSRRVGLTEKTRQVLKIEID
jgi:tRNA(Ile)-lysidine synthase